VREEHRSPPLDPRELRTITLGRVVQDLDRHGFPSAIDREGILVLGRGDVLWQAPVRLVMDDVTLQEFVRSAAGGATEIWPDDTAAVAGYRYFLRWLGDELVHEVVPGSVITVNRHDLESAPVRRQPEGPAEFMTFDEYRAHYGREPYIDPARVNPFD
jgi:hypothetical protein